MKELTNARLEEIALYGAQYNTTETREMAKELLNLREQKAKTVVVVTGEDE